MRRALALAILLAAAPVLAAAFPSVLRVPRSPAARADASFPRALFSHRVHAASGCFACHPSTFPQAPLAFLHEDMARGRACGHCHDGRTAVAVTNLACGACHVAP
jgi:c(7)-type cytochrome triheme protein